MEYQWLEFEQEYEPEQAMGRLVSGSNGSLSWMGQKGAVNPWPIIIR